MRILLLTAVIAVLCACQGNQNTPKPYVLVVPVDVYTAKGTEEVAEKTETDTVEVASPLEAYNKGIQKYAAVLMHVAQFPDSVKEVKALRIIDTDGTDVVPAVPQEQRDSVIMNFIQFARRSDIPYYDRVKDFELKLMKAR